MEDTSVDLTVVRLVELATHVLRVDLPSPREAALTSNLLWQSLEVCRASPNSSLLHSAAGELLDMCLRESAASSPLCQLAAGALVSHCLATAAMANAPAVQGAADRLASLLHEGDQLTADARSAGSHL